MSLKLNCWEAKRCGRQPGGDKCLELGTCPTPLASQTNGINRGFMGGRVCWAIAGTLCEGQEQGTYAMKMESCLRCEFYRRVKDEEGEDFQSDFEILRRLYSPTGQTEQCGGVK